MRNPIKSAPLYKNYDNFNAIARALLEEHKDIFDGCNERVLGNKIGELNNGKTTWWAKRPDKMKCLSVLLGLDENALSLDQESNPHVFRFGSFPNCPPLDLMRENAWEISEPRLMSGNQEVVPGRYQSKPTLSRWLSAEPLTGRTDCIEWLQISDSMEYDLLTRKLAATGGAQMVSRQSLQDVINVDIAHVRRPVPLVVAVRDVAQGSDVVDLCRHRANVPLLIISPWTPPELPTAGSADGQEKISLNHWVWSKLPNWRDRLLLWVYKRIERQRDNDSPCDFLRGICQTILDKCDTGHQWFACIDDVLTLCHVVSRQQDAELEGVLKGKDALTELPKLLFDGDKESLAHLQHIIRARWQRWDLSWQGDLSLDAWMALSKSPYSVDLLLRSKLLVHKNEGYSFAHPVVVRLLLCGQLINQLREDPVAEWNPACFDGERRPLLDAALDVLEPRQLSELATKLLQEPDSAESVGAGEALYAAIGRRLLRGARIGTYGSDIAAGSLGIAKRVLDRLRWKDDFLGPWSRPINAPSELLEWISVCWAWSLENVPGVDVTPSSWLFPGWSNDLPDELPKSLAVFCQKESAFSWERLAEPMRGFFYATERWLGRQPDATKHGSKHFLPFNAGLLLHAGNGQWPACAEWWWGVIGDPGTESALLRCIESKTQSEKAAVALAWWPSLVKYRRSVLSDRHSVRWYTPCLFMRDRSARDYSHVIDWVLTQVEQEGVNALNVLDEDDREYLFMNPASLPTTVKREMLQILANRLPLDLPPYEVGRFFLDYGQDVTAEMELFLADPQLGELAARSLWDWEPRAAENLLGSATTLPPRAVRSLIRTCPPKSVAAAVAVLQSDAQILSGDELSEWARWHLPDARQYASDLLHLVNIMPDDSGDGASSN